MKSSASFVSKKTAVIATLLLGCSSQVSHGLLPASQTKTSLSHGILSSPLNSRSTQLASSKESSDDILYSFGAEVVPEGQRPVNEYIDMKAAPLFGWGSNEVGFEGLLKRLGIAYAAIFLLV